MDKLEVNHRPYSYKFYGLIALFCLIILTIFSLSLNALASSEDDINKKNHIITIYDDDNEKTIISSASSVGDALGDAEITVSKYDLVDPVVDTDIEDDTVIIKIHRARPIVILDGNRQVRVITAAHSVSDIAKAAGVNLYPEDKASVGLVKDVLSAGGAGLQMDIIRAKLIKLKLYGQDLNVRTQAGTVSEFLKEKKIQLGPDDGLSNNPSEKIVDGMALQIWRNGIQTITATETINFTTRTINDPNRSVGYREVQTQGQNGEKTVIYQVEMRDGQEVSRTKISEVTNSDMVEQVEVIGTKVDLPPGSHEDWMQMAGISSNDYGYVNYIVGRESGWSPTKYNYAGSGAYGLCQSLPASKMAAFGSDYMTNPITQLKWCNSYAVGRYGSWSGAYNFWMKNHWW